MPNQRPTLTMDGARRLIERHSLIPSSGRRVGIEIEWLPFLRGDRKRRIPFQQIRDLVASTILPCGSVPTFEPGGQLELSSLPHPDAASACDAIAADTAAVRVALAPAGIELVGLGLDERPLPRVLDAPRYAAMEAFFDADGPAGRRMMRNTAAVQINVDAGTGAEVDRRWRLAHALAPVLGAAFANSPSAGWKSARLGTWLAMDRTRTWPAVSEDGAMDAWTRYAMRARLMLIRGRADRFTPVLHGMTLEGWIRDGHPLGYPTDDDVAYHLTTLFPPVRLRGWMELRFVDALPEPWWRVAPLVVSALLDDEAAAAAAEAAAAPAADLWHQAARLGLTHPVLAEAARACFAAALEAMARLGARPEDAGLVAAYADRYAFGGRSPADDGVVRLDETIPEVAWT